MAAKKKATFAGNMAKVPKKTWEAARTAEPGGKRELPQIEDGVYPCRMKKMKCDVDGNGNSYVAITLTVIDGEYEGVILDKFHSLKDFEADLPRLVKTLKGAGYEVPEQKDPAAYAALIEGIAKDVNDNEPEVLVSVQNGEYEAKRDTEDYKKGDMVPKLDVYINRPRSIEEGAATTKTKKTPAKKARK